MRRLSLFFIAAFVPVILLVAYLPNRALPWLKTADIESDVGADVVVFVEENCPHCADFKHFALTHQWHVEYLDITVPENQNLYVKLRERAPGLAQGVPTFIIDGTVTQGYQNEETTGSALTAKLEQCRKSEDGCLPFREFLETDDTVLVRSAAEGTCIENCEVDLGQYVFNLWFIGEVDLTLLSLPALSILLGFLDGFNPCAMWVLITLLTLLINTSDMKKVWLIGGTFLFVSGAVYYFFIAAWLNVFLLVGFNEWVQKIIGLIAVGGGGFYLFEAFAKDPNACKVTSSKRKQRTIQHMNRIMGISAWPLMILGVSILAISVNTIELVCTAGLPAIFTQILAFNDISHFARYMYILIYIILYMIDDLAIFGIAVYTLHATGLTTKYRRFTLIFGGLLMYGLGVLLIFAPEVLTFA